MVQTRKVQKVEFPPALPKLLRVAAYARVSCGKDAMLQSLSAQISYYSDYIQKHPGWQFAGVYADEAKTGTRDSREQFQRLLQACRQGAVDMVITKSISRFARNTVTLLETVRELRRLGIDVYFEEQNIHTLNTEGELMISLLASYAQEESLSASENQKWRIRRNFEAGKPWDATLMGYRYETGRYVIQPDEAEIVRRIFREYLGGKGVDAIANDLNADGIPTRLGYKWRNNGVLWILRNYTYTGNLLLQKYYRDDYISKKSRINRGQMPRFHVTAAHDPIICVEDYEAVQEEIERRAAKHAKKGKDYNARYPYSGLIVCAGCGKKYRRKVKRAGPVWICSTYNTKGKTECASKAIPEAVLDELTADIDLTSIAQIQAEKDNRLVFCYKDGTTQEKLWQDRSRAESWTPEMKERARRKERERRVQNA